MAMGPFLFFFKLIFFSFCCISNEFAEFFLRYCTNCKLFFNQFAILTDLFVLYGSAVCYSVLLFWHFHANNGNIFALRSWLLLSRHISICSLFFNYCLSLFCFIGHYAYIKHVHSIHGTQSNSRLSRNEKLQIRLPKWLIFNFSNILPFADRFRIICHFKR